MRTLFVALMMGLICGTVSAREWTSVDGKQKVEGKLIGVANGRAYIETAKGKAAIPLERLSPADREYAQSQKGILDKVKEEMQKPKEVKVDLSGSGNRCRTAHL